MTKIKTKRNSAGEYTVTDGRYKVNISKIDYGYGPEWIAALNGSMNTYTDPLPTKRDAVRNAEIMINRMYD